MPCPLGNFLNVFKLISSQGHLCSLCPLFTFLQFTNRFIFYYLFMARHSTSLSAVWGQRTCLFCSAIHSLVRAPWLRVAGPEWGVTSTDGVNASGRMTGTRASGLIHWRVSLRVHVKDTPILPCCHKTQPDRVLTRCNCSVQSPILVGGGWTAARCQGKSSTANPRLPLKSRTFNRKTKASTNALQATCAGGTWRRAGSFSTVSSRNVTYMRVSGAVPCSKLWWPWARSGDMPGNRRGSHVSGLGCRRRVSVWSVHAFA